MFKLRHEQRSLWEDLFAAEVADLWAPWMRVVDELWEDDELLDAVYEEQGEPHQELCEQLKSMSDGVRQIVRQTRACV